MTVLTSTPTWLISTSMRSPGLHPQGRRTAGADPGRRARGDDVARLQVRESGDIGNRLGDGKIMVEV